MFKKKFKAKARPRPTPGKMNKTEEAYSWILEGQKKQGLIDHWEFEPFKLRLADRTTYTPDFLVIKDGFIIICEVKGAFIYEDSTVKFKIAREHFWYFEFIMMQFKDKVWKEKKI